MELHIHSVLQLLLFAIFTWGSCDAEAPSPITIVSQSERAQPLVPPRSIVCPVVVSRHNPITQMGQPDPTSLQRARFCSCVKGKLSSSITMEVSNGGNNQFRMEKLVDHNNYKYWRICMEAYLHGQDL